MTKILQLVLFALEIIYFCIIGPNFTPTNIDILTLLTHHEVGNYIPWVQHQILLLSEYQFFPKVFSDLHFLGFASKDFQVSFTSVYVII